MKPLDPNALASIKGLTLRVKFVADGVLGGLHRSRHHGANIEFLEHKEYSPGDDIRHIDWRAYARRDKYSLKRFEHDTRICGHIVVDRSASMSYHGSYGDEGLNKLEYSKILAGSLAFLMLHQGDVVSLSALGGTTDTYIPPRSGHGHFPAIVHELEMLRPEGKSSLISGLEGLGQKITRRELLFIFSDLLDEPRNFIRKLRVLRKRNIEIVVFHILDPWEIDFPFKEITRFEGLETNDHVIVDGNSIRKSYQEEVNRYLEQMRGGCLQEHIRYCYVTTNMLPGDVLVQFLQGQN